MGASYSCSSAPTETVLEKIDEYTKLMREPGGRDHHRDIIRFRHLWWVITVSSADFNEETGFSEFLQVCVFLGSSCRPESADLGIAISLEILDKTGLETVFQRESSRWGTGRKYRVPETLLLTVRRRELEASSCVRRRDDCFYVRCTIKEQPGLLARWFPPSKSAEVYVAMARCETFTLHSLSETKAALRSGECFHSTRFDVGGRRWYLKLDPTLALVYLVRATKEDDETRTTAEFSFALQGAVNVRSDKMTHTFDRHSPDCAFEYQQQPEEEEEPAAAGTGRRAAGNQLKGPPVNVLLSTRDILFSYHVTKDDPPSTTSTDGLIVRCRVKIIPDLVAPTAVVVSSSAAATVVRPASPAPVSPTESERTCVLSAMQN